MCGKKNGSGFIRFRDGNSTVSEKGLHALFMGQMFFRVKWSINILESISIYCTEYV